MKHSFEFILVFVLGIVIGGGGCWYWIGTRYSNQIVDCSYTMLVDDVNTLAMLSKQASGELMEDKENDLSYTLFGLSSVVKLDSISDKRLKYLKMAAGYRNKYAFKTGDTNVDHRVEDFLRRVREKP